MNQYEYIVKQKSEGVWRWRRFAMVALYVLLTLAFLVTFLAINFPWAITFLPLLVWMLIFFTWRFVSPEYEYAMLSGEITFTKAYNGTAVEVNYENTWKDYATTGIYTTPIADGAAYRLVYTIG